MDLDDPSLAYEMQEELGSTFACDQTKCATNNAQVEALVSYTKPVSEALASSSPSNMSDSCLHSVIEDQP